MGTMVMNIRYTEQVHQYHWKVFNYLVHIMSVNWKMLFMQFHIVMSILCRQYNFFNFFSFMRNIDRGLWIITGRSRYCRCYLSTVLSRCPSQDSISIDIMFQKLLVILDFSVLIIWKIFKIYRKCYLNQQWLYWSLLRGLYVDKRPPPKLTSYFYVHYDCVRWIAYQFEKGVFTPTGKYTAIFVA